MLKFIAPLLFVAATTASCLAQVSPAPVRVSGAVASKLEKQRVPLQMSVAWRYRYATVRLEFTVLPDGTVTDIKTLDLSPVNTFTKALEDDTRKGLTRWTYNPYLVNGRPTAMRVTILFKYHQDLDISYP
jgi:TonB family protein